MSNEKNLFGTAGRYSRSQEQWKRGNPIMVNVIMERIPVQINWILEHYHYYHS